MRIEATSITNANAGELLAEGSAAIARGDFAFDLQAVTEVDTAAIALLLAWQRRRWPARPARVGGSLRARSPGLLQFAGRRADFRPGGLFVSVCPKLPPSK
jgi:phospholipid transport system transporter-binding protein